MAKKEQKEPTKQKSKYNMWQNCCFMIGLAVKHKEKKVPILCTLTALLAVAINLTEISITPAIIGAVEIHAPLPKLFAVIAGFVLLRMLLIAVSSYVGTNILYGKVTLRLELISQVNTKRTTTSYPNTYDEQFQKMEAKANDSYYLLKKTQTPIIIAECGFLSNSEEAGLLTKESYQDRVAWAIHLGVLRYAASLE